MKISLSKLVPLFFFLVGCSSLYNKPSRSFSSDDTLIIATSNQSFANYMNIEDGHPVSGFEFDLMNKICLKINLRCEWKTVDPEWSKSPFPGILEGLNKAEYDIAIAFMRGTTDRLENFSGSIPYLQTKTAFFGPSNDLDEITYQGRAPLKENGDVVRFATIGAYNTSVEKIYQNEGISKSRYQITKVESIDELVDQILSGKADLTYSSAGNASLVEKGLIQHRFITPSPSVEWGPRIYSRDPEVMKKINQALEEIMKDESDNGYLALVKRYSLKHYVYPIIKYQPIISCDELLKKFIK